MNKNQKIAVVVLIIITVAISEIIEAPNKYLLAKNDVGTTSLLKDMKLKAFAISIRIKESNAVVLAISTL